MKLAATLLTALLSVLPLAAASTPEAASCPTVGVTYGVTLQPAEHLLHVDAVTHAPVESFQLPAWNALYQVRDFAVNVRRAEAEAGVPRWMCAACAHRAAQVQKIDKTSWRVVDATHNPCLTFSYDIVADTAGAFDSYLDGQRGFFNWAELLVYRPDQRMQPVSLRLMGVPDGWYLRDGGVLGNRMDGRAASYDRLVDAPVLLGRLYERRFRQDGATYHLATDSPDVDLAATERMVRRLTVAATGWMQDRPFDDYTFLYLVDGGVGSGGMEHANAAVIDVGERMKQDASAAAEISAHEFFHLWNVKRIRPQSLEPVDYTQEQYTRALWFSEGVTNTVTDILLVRAGYYDERRALAHLARVIGTLESRPARRTQSAEESSLEAWFEKYPAYLNSERSVSYYTKGEVLGVLLDLEMRRRSGGRRSLRDLFQFMNAHYAKPGRFFADSDGVQAAAEAVVGGDFRQFFARYVAGVDDLPYADEFAWVGLRLVHETGERVDAGLALTPGTATIAAVESGSAAARAHVEPGATVLEANGEPVRGHFARWLESRRPGEKLHLKLRAHDGRLREVEFALGTKKFDEYRLEESPDATAEERARRAAWLQGEAQ